jgi:hypothetical protein
MSQVMFAVLLCVALLATAMVGSWVWDFHKSDAAGQGLAHAYTVIVDIFLLVVLGVLVVSSGGGLLLIGYLAIAGTQFFTLVVLTELDRDSQYELGMRVLFALAPLFLAVVSAMKFYKRFGDPPGWIVSLVAIGIAAALLAMAVPARADAQVRQEARTRKWQEDRAKDEALAATIKALPADTPLADLLPYTTHAWDSETFRASVDRIVSIANRQEQAVAALNNEDVRMIRLLDKLNLTVTPELCEAARKCLRKGIEQFRPSPAAPTFSEVEYDANQYSIAAGWLVDGKCNCKAELAALQANIELYPDPYPKKFFVDHLLRLQGQMRE